MKIRGESGGVPARMGGGAGAASRGGKAPKKATVKTPEQKTYEANKLKYGARIANTIRSEAKITANMPKNPKRGAKDADYYKGIATKSPRIAETVKSEAKITADMLKKRAAKKTAK
jgi:hypothetical protein